LNGAPHAITAGCYSADRSPSPIKTRVKATSWGGTEEKKAKKNKGEGREPENKNRRQQQESKKTKR